MIAAYGGKCGCCAESTWEFLTIDHVGGGGHQERKRLKKKGTDFYLWLRRNGWPQDDYRLLCYNCNLACGFYGHCPHQGLPPEDVLPGAASKSEKSRFARRQHRRAARAELLAAYGGKCCCCLVSEPAFLALDHVHGGGCQERAAKINCYDTFIRRLRRENWPDSYRLLCHNCNCCLGISGHCPHQRDRQAGGPAL